MRWLALLLAGVLALSHPARAETSIFDLRSRLVQLLLSQISTPGSFEVTVDTVEADDDGATRLLGLKVSDEEGVWIEAEVFTLSWTLSSLLDGELEIPLVAVDGLTVLRQPAAGSQAPALREGEPDPAASIFDWPRTPISTRIGEMRLSRISIAKSVLGSAIRFNATGQAEDAGDRQFIQLDLTRSDGIEGSIGLLIDRDFSEEELRLNLTADEAPGGLVAALFGLPAQSASRLKLEADGPADEWRLSFSSRIDGLYRAEGRATASLIAPLSLEAEFTVAPETDMKPEIAALLVPQARLSARVKETGGAIALEELSITSPDLELLAKGRFLRSEESFDLSLRLRGGTGLSALTGKAAFEALEFTGRLAGTAEQFDTDGDARITGLTSPEFDAETLALKLAWQQLGEGSILEVSGTGDGLRIDRLQSGLIGRARLAARGSLQGGTLTIEQASLEANPISLRVAGTARTDLQNARLGLTLTVPKLAPVAAAYGQELAGALSFDGRLALVEGRPDLHGLAVLRDLRTSLVDAAQLHLAAGLRKIGTSWAFHAAAGTERLRLDRLGPELLGDARIELTGALTGETIAIEQARLASSALSAEIAGQFDLSGQDSELTYRLATAELTPLAQAYALPLTGEVAATGSFALKAGQPRLTGSLRAAVLGLEEETFRELSLQHDLILAPTVGGTVSLRGALEGIGPLRLATEIGFDDPMLSFRALEASALGLDLSGELDADLSVPHLEGGLELAASSLAPLGDWLGMTLAGRLSGGLVLSGPALRQDARLDATLQGASIEGVQIDQAMISARLQDVLGDVRTHLDAKLRGLQADALTLSLADISARGPLSALDTRMELRGRLGDKELSLSSSARLNGVGEPRGRIRSLQAQLGKLALRLAQPVNFTAQGDGIALRPLNIEVGEGGRIAGRLYAGPDGLAGALEIAAIELSGLGELTDTGIKSGRLAGEASFDTRPGSARAELSARIADLALEALDGAVQSVSATIKAGWNGRRAQIAAELRAGAARPLTARLTLPLRPDGPLPVLPRSEPVDGRLSWKGQIGTLWALLPLPDQELTGKGVIDLGIGGSIAAPRLSGTLSISGGRFQHLLTGTILTDLTLTSRVDPSGAFTVSLKARDGADGRVTAEARLAQRLEARIRAEGAVLIRRDDVTARLSSDISLSGPLDALVIKGPISIDRAEVRLVDASPPTILDLGKVRVKGQTPPAGEDDRPGRIRLNIPVRADGGIFVRGRGLDSEWRADLVIGGPASAPRITGEISKLRGRFDLLGKPFDLLQGRLAFSGRQPVDPELAVVLERTGNGITGRIALSGPVSAPEFDFTSVPGLPPDEVLPRLLFDTSRQGLSAAQALQLAAGIRTLTSGERGVFDTARDTIGVDVLQIDRGEDATEVTLGKTVAPGIFVGAKRELAQEGRSAVTVEIEVFDNFKLEGEAGPDRSSIGIGWQKDF